MTPSPACYSLIKRFEGCRLDAYKDGGGVLTIGVGHTGPEVHADSHISQDIADAYLLKDVTHAADAVSRCVTVPLTQGQFDALVSFVFNVGADAFAKSTLLRKLNAGDTLGASLALLKWNHVNAVVSEGLTRRRSAEQSLFLS